MTELAKFSRS